VEVGAGVRRIGTRYINCYLIEEGGRLTLLDAGLPGYWGLLLSELGAMGRRLEDIDAVLVTHSHPDHFGTERESAEFL
jgi:glyoxylase-like metal-dependent hydrolase (beta-lactamase superfamily II)